MNPRRWEDFSTAAGRQFFLSELTPDQVMPSITRHHGRNIDGFFRSTVDLPEAIPHLVWSLVAGGDVLARGDGELRNYMVSMLQDYADDHRSQWMMLRKFIKEAEQLLSKLASEPVRPRDPRPEVWALGATAWAIRLFAKRGLARRRYRQELQSLEEELRRRWPETEESRRWRSDSDYEPRYSWDWYKSDYHPAGHIRAARHSLGQ